MQTKSMKIVTAISKPQISFEMHLIRNDERMLFRNVNFDKRVWSSAAPYFC